MSSLVESVTAAKASIQNRFSDDIDCAVVLGSGLSDLALSGYKTIERIPYGDIAGLPRSTAPSHKGELTIISNGEKTIALCAGRHHLYEGYSAQQVAALSYTLAELGAKELIITNAAGALNSDFLPGDIMIIEDHINFTGHNPLHEPGQELEIAFPDMSRAYDRDLISNACAAAKKYQLSVHKGVYIGVMGPSLETSAERRMMRGFGADAVGMSTVLEVIAANHCGMRVLGLSAITNLALGDQDQQPDTIEEVLANAAIAGQGIEKILNEILNG